MRVNLFTLVCAVISLSGCELSTISPAPVTDSNNQFCLTADSDVQQYNCDLSYWMRYWIEQDAIPWKQRKSAIQSCADDVTGQLKKVLMSQAADTPYQDRLRAQNWAEKLMPQLSEPMQQLLTVIVFKPSQAILEYESALTILTRLNSQQAEQLQQQQAQLEQQRSQIDAFMKIEASIVEAVEETP